MTHVKIELFKFTGKWYMTISSVTDREVFDHYNIIKDMKYEYPMIEDYDFTIEITKGNAVNWRLVKNS